MLPIIIVLLLCLVAVANSLAPSQLASKTPTPNVSKDQPSSKEEKPSLKPCKPIETYQTICAASNSGAQLRLNFHGNQH
ncbi:GM23609 [Drosophila sechellia]|uniref:GM23609 n=1 Tax=Drosophila sechellia TaxID=7238 RepID=B4HEU5_DROSE|nr:GM23609 [Drosophila sechellia]